MVSWIMEENRDNMYIVHDYLHIMLNKNYNSGPYKIHKEAYGQN